MLRLIAFVLLALTLVCSANGEDRAAESGLIGHWPLTTDAHDASASGNHGRAQQVLFTADGALFDGRAGHIEIPHHSSLDLSAGEFSVSLHVHTAADLDDALGDLINKFDPAARRGFNLSIKHHAGVTGSQSNYRNLQFGIDQGRQDAEWKDGRSAGELDLCAFHGCA
jgi:hypothetical protein